MIFNCITCSKSFISENVLKYHTDREHTTKANCKLCYYDYENEWSLKKHNNRLHNTNEEMKALQSYQIDNERLVHTCLECYQKFLTENILNFHTRYRHTISNGDKKYCKLCYLKFKDASYLRKHQEKIHSNEMSLFDIQIDPAILKHTCKLCDKNFFLTKF